MPGTERVSIACGVEFVYTMATIKAPHMQVSLEHVSYQVLGFASGYDREFIDEGTVKRVLKAALGKDLVSADCILQPDSRNLTPKTRQMFELMFPGSYD